SESAEWEDFAVLYRMNAQSRLLEENMRRLHIPYRLVGGKSFFDRREIKDVIAYIRCPVNPDDDASLLRIINTPPRGMGESTVERALEHSVANECSLFVSLQNPCFDESLSRRASAAIREFVSLLDQYETRVCQLGA